MAANISGEFHGGSGLLAAPHGAALGGWPIVRGLATQGGRSPRRGDPGRPYGPPGRFNSRAPGEGARESIEEKRFAACILPPPGYTVIASTSEANRVNT